MSEWQPIETAPIKERVLVCDDFKDVMISICFDGVWYEDGTELHKTKMSIPPTYWMPIPEPPKGKSYE